MKIAPINHLELVLSFVSIFSGIIVIILGYIDNKKENREEKKAGMVFTTGIGIYIFSNFILYYINRFIQKNTGNFSMTLNDLSIVIVIFSIYYAVQKVIVKKRNNFEIILLVISMLIYIVIYQIVYFKYMTVDNHLNSRKVETVLFFLEIIVRCIVIFIIGKAVINLKKIENQILKKRLIQLITVLLLYMAVSFFDSGIIIVLVYFGINIYGILFLIKRLKKEEIKEVETRVVEKSHHEVIGIDDIAEKYDLTLTEKEIVALVYKGFTNAEIAGMRAITLSTVKRHVYNVFKKLDVSNRIEMVHLIKND